MRPFCRYNPVIKFLLKYFVILFIKLMQPPFREGYNLETAARIKQSVSLPIITVGGMRSRQFLSDVIEKNMTDFVSMARPLILEPDLPNKFKSAASDTALCDNCNQCVVAVDTVPIQCHNHKLIHKAKSKARQSSFK